jgi:hypothetical protein
MGNHADNFIISDNYVAGLVDSDFGVFINRFYPRGKLQLRPTINFTNTNFDLIEKCYDYLKINGINHHIRFNKATIGKDKKCIEILRLSMVALFSDKIKSYCVVRRPHLEVLSSYCSDRLIYVNELGWKQNNTPYTDYQKNLYDEIVELNMNYNYDLGYRNGTLSWLGGYIDGDGSICFVVSKKRIIPTVDITTGSDASLNNITEMYNKYDIKYDIRITKSKATKRLGRNKKKVHYNIYVRNFGSIEKLLNLLNGKLIAKQRQLELMLLYLNIKKVNRFNTDEIWDIVDRVKFINRNPNYKDISETNTQDTNV